MDWKQLSLADREREYSPSSCLPDGDYRPFVERYRTASNEAWAYLETVPNVTTTVVAYGEADTQTIDVAVRRDPASPNSGGAGVPLVVFIHGGYWQELSKMESRFAARDCIEQGWAFAAVDYTLAPAATLDEIVAECRAGVGVLHERSVDLGFDSSKIFVAGSSAGAQLAAMVALDTETNDTETNVAGTVLVSGIFELEALIGLSINDALALDHDAAQRNSPLLLDVDGFPSTVLAYGSEETGEFKAQTNAFATHLDAVSTPTHHIEVPDRNHFDVILDLAAPGTRLGDAVTHLISTAGHSSKEFGH